MNLSERLRAEGAPGYFGNTERYATVPRSHFEAMVKVIERVDALLSYDPEPKESRSVADAMNELDDIVDTDRPFKGRIDV